jgi:thioredoxin-dependent peroxiredoxin
MEQIATWMGSGMGTLPVVSTGNAGARLEPGSLAPTFSLPNSDMGIFDLSQVLCNKSVVLHFYPRDAMPSSVRQAISFSDHDEDFSALGVLVVGISLDDCLIHADFRDQHGIAMELLSDPEGEVCRQYCVWQPRELDGLVRPAVHRSTFVIGRNGVLLLADYNVDVRDHTEKLLGLLKSISDKDARRVCRRY